MKTKFIEENICAYIQFIFHLKSYMKLVCLNATLRKYQDTDLFGMKNSVFRLTYHQLAESDIV